MSRFESRPIKHPTLLEAAQFCQQPANRDLMQIIARGKMLNNGMSIKNGKLYYKVGKSRKAVIHELDINLPPEILAYQFELFADQVMQLNTHQNISIQPQFATAPSPALCRKRLMDYYENYCASSGMSAEQISTSLDNIAAAYDVGVITQKNIFMVNGVVQGVNNVYLDSNTGVLFAYCQPERLPLEPVYQQAHKQITVKDTTKLREVIVDHTDMMIRNISVSVLKNSTVTPHHSVVIPVTTN